MIEKIFDFFTYEDPQDQKFPPTQKSSKAIRKTGQNFVIPHFVNVINVWPYTHFAINIRYRSSNYESP